MFCYKIFRQDDDILLAICDKSIVGKTFSEKDLSITANSDFYSEKECGDQQIMKLVKGATIVNALGNQIVSFLVSKSIVNKSNVIEIGGVMHAQVVAVW
jgi:hypothetical protein